jgi:Ca2+-binding RTX toxin-like protein
MRGAGVAAMGQGTLTIRDSIVRENHIDASGAGAGTARGGGIHLASTAAATIDRSSISENVISGDGTGAGDAQTLRGAGISTNDAAQDVTITNSQIAFNGMSGGDLQQGGGMDWDESGNDDMLRLTNVTFSANEVGAGHGAGLYANGDAVLSHTTFGPNTAQFGAGLFVGSGPVQVRNSLFETGTTADCGGAEQAVSLGYNIERGPSEDCHFDQPTDQLPDQTLMSPLDDNGGPTRTHQVAFAFLDLIPQASCLGAGGAPLTRDQRNALRPGLVSGGGTMCDPGAYELNRCGPGTVVEIVGSEGNDQLTGTSDADGIMGMGGNDTLAGGDGVDGMCAGDGDDVLAGDEEDGALDFFRGDAGSDTLSFGTFSDVLTLDLANTTSQTAGSGLGNISQTTIENVLGGVHVDTLLGDAGPNRLDGNPGNDPMIVGNGGSDTLLGNTGNDGLFARDGQADVVDCGAGTADTAQTDRLSLDSVVNCETVDALPEPPVTPTTPSTAPAPAKKKCKKKKRKKRSASAVAKCKKKKKKRKR